MSKKHLRDIAILAIIIFLAVIIIRPLMFSPDQAGPGEQPIELTPDAAAPADSADQPMGTEAPAPDAQ